MVTNRIRNRPGISLEIATIGTHSHNLVIAKATPIMEMVTTMIIMDGDGEIIEDYRMIMAMTMVMVMAIVIQISRMRDRPHNCINRSSNTPLSALLPKLPQFPWLPLKSAQ